MRKSIFLSVILLFILTGSYVFAQKERRVIQLSGIVLGLDEKDNATQLPGVNIYVPEAGRGTNTNGVGFFSMPVLVSDSIVISYVGFERQFYIVPDHPNEYLTLVIQMIPDVTYLKEIEIMPFPTEEIFKEAVLALNISDDGIDRKNLNQRLLGLMLSHTPMDGPQNQRYYLGEWASSQGTQYAPVQNPLFNPFNWARFFQSLKQNKK